MLIEYIHASQFGNGLTVAEEFRRLMAGRDVSVDIHHISEIDPAELPAADLYLFSSPGRFGRPIAEMGRFLRRLSAPEGARYAILTTEMAPQPGTVPSGGSLDQEQRYQRIIPAMDIVLQRKGLTGVAADRILVTDLRGPLEEGWRERVEAFADRLLA